MIAPNPDGIRELKKFALRLAFLASGILIVSAILTFIALGTVPAAACLSILLRCLVPLLPILALAYVSGCTPAGSKERLETRLILAAYVVLCLVIVIHAFDMSVLGLASGAGMSVDSMHTRVEFSSISWILMVIPVCSAADAIAEYVESNKETA